jgi:hypothetical protein
MLNLINDLDKSFGSAEGILVKGDSTFAIRDLLTGHEAKCYFPGYLSEDAQNAIGRRVAVFGLLFSNESGKRCG